MLAIANNCTKIFVIAVDTEIKNKQLVVSLINKQILSRFTNIYSETHCASLSCKKFLKQ